MNGSTVQPTSIEEFCEVVRATARKQSTLHISGARSKIQPGSDDVAVSSTGYSGIVDHQASDFTITLRAGTTIHEVHQALETAGQHLPFDPPCVDCGTTVGGLIGTGLSGPCRLKHGGIRDFVIGCQYIDGKGTVARAGGKVVKNAAGFDLPKFLIGSAGRFGLITEVTFKVFPKPNRYRTFRFAMATIRDARLLVRQLMGLMDWEAMEILADNVVLARVAGEARPVLDSAVGRIKESLAGDFDIIDDDAVLWHELSNLRDFSRDHLLVKIPSTPARTEILDQAIAELVVSRRYSAAGHVCLAALDSIANFAALNDTFHQLGLMGQLIVGPSKLNLVGNVKSLPFLARVKRAMDPHDVFGSIEKTQAEAVS